MGLDMYLIRVKKEQKKPNETITQSVDRDSYIWDEVYYWRKANQIHKWFVDNVQHFDDNCDYYEVSRDQIKELLDKCEVILEDIRKCDNILPTQKGFFFGGTEYDEYYIQTIIKTRDKLQEIVRDFDFENNYLVYGSSW